MLNRQDILSFLRDNKEYLQKHFHLTKVGIFGSFARDEQKQDSDIDLLIIKATRERFFDRLDTVRRVTTGTHPHIPFEPIVLTPEEIERRLKAGDQFLSEIMERGELLYAT